MAKFSISTKFTAFDGVSKVISKMRNSLGSFEKRVATSKKSVGGLFSSVGKIAGGVFGGNLLTQGFYQVNNAIRTAYLSTVELDDALSSVSAKSGVSKTSKEFIAFENEVKSLASSTEYTAEQIGKAAEKWIMSGKSLAQTTSLLSPSINLATASSTDLITSTDMVSDAIGALNLETNDLAQAQKNAIAVSDLLAKGSNSANLTMSEFFESIKKGAGSFIATGQSIETFSALTLRMADLGDKGTESGISLNAALIRLIDPPKKAKDALEKLNVAVRNEAGEMRDFVDILQDVKNGENAVSKATYEQSLSAIFGVRHSSKFLKVLNAGLEPLYKHKKNLNDVAGSTQNVANIMRQGLGKQIELLKSGILSFTMNIVEGFGKGSGAIAKLIMFFSDLNAQQDMIRKKVQVFANVLGTVGSALLKIVKFLWDYQDVVIALTIALATYKAIMSSIAIVQALVSATNPFGLIAIAVGGVIAGVVLLIKHWDKIINKIKQFLQIIGILKKSPIISTTAGMDSLQNEKIQSKLQDDSTIPALQTTASSSGMGSNALVRSAIQSNNSTTTNKNEIKLR